MITRVTSGLAIALVLAVMAGAFSMERQKEINLNNTKTHDRHEKEIDATQQLAQDIMRELSIIGANVQNIKERLDRELE